MSRKGILSILFDVPERAAALAEKSGSLTQLIHMMVTKVTTTLMSGELYSAMMLADQVLDLALREDSPNSLGLLHLLHTVVRY